MSRQTADSKLVTLYNPGSPLSEAYRTLRTNIQFSAVDHPIQTLMITSANAGEGKTTTASNLAITYAQEGKRTLFIDGDLRKPSLHQVFMLSNRTGLTHALTNEQRWQAVVQETSTPYLFLMTSGPIPPNPSEILGSQKMKALLEELREHFDVILIDTPPILAVADGLILSSLSDGVVIVVKHGETKYAFAKKVKQNLEHVKARVLGVVLNNEKRNKNAGYYYAYGSDK